MKMTTKKWLPAAALITAGLSGTANAVPTQWIDTVDFTPDRLVTIFSPVEYTHTVEGFTAGVDTVSNYSLSFNLYDDVDYGFFDIEAAVLSQPGSWVDAIYFNLSGTESGGWTLSGRYQIEQSGSLTVAISALLGDFYLGGSTLTVNGDKKSVPEPGTLGMLGAALVGFGLFRRRKQNA